MFARTKWGRDSFPDRALASLGMWHLLARWADSGWKRPFLKVLCVARADRRDEWGWQASVIYLLHSAWFGSGVLDVGFQTNRGGWVTRLPGRNEREKSRKSVSCVGSSTNHQEDGIFLWGDRNDAFETWCFRGALRESVTSDLVLLFQTCLLFSSLTTSSLRGVELSGFLQLLWNLVQCYERGDTE